jgi:hypothetical protein
MEDLDDPCDRRSRGTADDQTTNPGWVAIVMKPRRNRPSRIVGSDPAQRPLRSSAFVQTVQRPTECEEMQSLSLHAVSGLKPWIRSRLEEPP